MIIFSLLLMFTVAIPVSAEANSSGYEELYTQDFQLMQLDENGNFQTNSNIGGYGTIKCKDGGAQTILCNWDVTLIKDYIQAVYIEFEIHDEDDLQWGSDRFYKNPIGGNQKTYRDQFEHKLYSSGKFKVTKYGSVAGREAIYAIAPVISATVAIK